jgi:hypothetical protein
MRMSVLIALALMFTACGFPEYAFEQETSSNASCEASPCQNDGTCVTLDGGGYACLCSPGFGGTYCELAVNPDDCSPNPCENGGVCFDGDATYTCECPAGFTGDTCSGENYRTCLEVLSAEPDAPSGVYVMDPDGPGAGRAPVSVLCDMTSDDAGWTLVGREAAGGQGTFRFLAEEGGLPNEIAEGTGNGLIGTRFAGQYTDVRFRWYGAGDGFIGFRPSEELFVNAVDTAIPVTNVFTSDEKLRDWVNEAGGASFCRASQSLDVRPGDTSWAIKPANDTNTDCGCNSRDWTGRGAFYGGNLNPTSCSASGGGWASVRDDHEQKGGILDYELEIWIR